MSILEEEQESGRPFFRWQAASERFSTRLAGTMPRWDSPCGAALDRDATILLKHPGLHFDFPPAFGADISEVLLVPFRVNGAPVGTLWVIAHDETRRFDREDVRILSSLGKFGSVACRHLTSHKQPLSERMCDALPAAIYTTDREGSLTYFNPAAAVLSGRTPRLGADQWCVSWKLYNLDGTPMSPDTSPMARAMTEEREIRGAEAILERPDGSRVWFAAYPTPVRDDKGRVVGGINMLVDIGERKRAELGIERGSEQFETLLNQAPLGVYLIDDEFRVRLANPAAAKAFGIPGLIGKDFEAILRSRRPKANADEILSRFRHTLATGQEYVVPERIVEGGEGGVREAYEWQINRIPLADDRFGVVCYFREISHLVMAREAIRQSEERLRLLAESMPQKILAASDTGDVTYCNKRWIEFSGKPFEEIRGWGRTELIHPQDREEAVHLWRHSVVSGEPLQVVHRLRRFDDIYRWHLTRIVPMRQPGDSITLWIGSNTDIHEQKQLEEELIRTNTDLNQFAYAASHDLQEPLRMIASYSQLLVNGYRGQLEGDAEACLNYITEGSRRMRELLSGLLSYAHAGAERSELITSVNLNTVFDKALQNLHATIADSGARVSSDFLPTVLGEEAHFVQLLQNLIGNSIKYHSGNEKPRVHVSVQRQGTAWRIAVTDNGVGIAPEDHQRIFGVFKRLSTKGVPGTGIGLAICQRVVERYGGRIWVESQLGQGATFYFTLPVAAEAAAGTAVCQS